MADLRLCFLWILLYCAVATEGLARTPPLITGEAPQSIAFKIGESLQLRCTASGIPTPSYSWTKDGRFFDVSGNDNRVTQQPNAGTIVMNDPMKKDEGTYQCFASNQAGRAATQKTILLSAQLDKFAPVETPEIRRGMIGDSLTLHCTPPKSIPRAEVFWTKVNADGGGSNVKLDNRVTMDTYGSLHFTNLKREDQSEDGGRYQCTASNKYTRGMNSGQDQVIVVEGDQPMGKIPQLQWATPDNRPIAVAGTKFSLKCIFSGKPTPKVTWVRTDEHGGVLQMGRNVTQDSFGQELVFNGVKPSDAGKYECKGSNMQAANPQRKPFDLKVESKPSWVEKPTSSMHGEHGNVTLHCSAKGQPTPSISWFVNGVPVARAAANPRRQVRPSSITYTDLHLSDTEVVQCNASNIHGYIFTNAYVTVLAVPPTWLIPPPPRIAFAEGLTVNVSCQTQAAPPATVVWTRDGTHLTGGRFHVYNDGNLRIENLVSTDAGQYQCTATNRFGNISETSDVFIRRSTRIVRQPDDLWVNIGTEAKFICTATTDPENLGELTIVWYKDRNPINFALSLRLFENLRDNSLTITDVQILDSARYTCKAITSYDVAEASAYLKVRAPPQPPKIAFVDCITKKSELKAIVKWHPDGTNYAPIRAYFIQYNTSFTPDQWTTLVEMVDDIQETTVDVQMSPYSNYSFRIIARNRLGNSIPSLPSGEMCTTTPATPSSNPTNVRVRGTTPTNLVITWTHLITCPQSMLPVEHNGLGFKYSISWQCVDEKCQNQRTDATSDSRYSGQAEVADYRQIRLIVDKQLTYKRYRVTVVAVNERGASSVPVVPVYGYSGSNAPSVAPTNFRVDANSVRSTSATFRWTPVPNDSRVIRGELRGYVVKFAFRVSDQIQRSIKMATFFFDHIDHRNATYIPTAEPTLPPFEPARGDYPGDAPAMEEETTTAAPARVKRSVVSMTEDEMVVVVDDLPAYTEVELTVAAVNEAYMGPESGRITVTTREGIPGPVGRLYAKRRLSNRVILVWDPPEEPNGILTGYMVAHREVNGLNLGDWNWDLAITEPEVRLSSVSGLRPSQQYRFFVYAVTAVGRGEVNFIDAPTISPGMPSPPTFTVTEITDHYINVTWVPSVTGNPGSVFYVQYRKTGRPEWESSRVETLHDWLNLTMLDAGTRYEVRVVARNGMDQEASTYTKVIETTGFSARLDLIIGHAWFICLFLLILIICLLLCGITYWKRNKPLRYPDPSEKEALNPDHADVGGYATTQELGNRGYEKGSTDSSFGDRPPVARGAVVYARVDKPGRLRSTTEAAEYGEEPSLVEPAPAYPGYAQREPDPPEVFSPGMYESVVV